MALDFNEWLFMKSKLFRNCAYISAVCSFIFGAIYAYVWITDSNPQVSEAGIHWSYISIARAKPLNGTNASGTYVYDGGDHAHVAVTKEWGGNLVVFNQNMPYTGGIISFTGDNTVNETGFTGFGLYFRHITHTVEKDKDWWTLMISLWYPIAIFAIFPLVFVGKKMRAARNLPTAGATT